MTKPKELAFDYTLGYFGLKKIYCIFNSIDNFKTWFVGILGFKVGFDVDIFDFQIEFWWRYFDIL
jgi:hypothetical protein